MLAADDTPPTTHDTLRPAHPEQPSHSCRSTRTWTTPPRATPSTSGPATPSTSASHVRSTPTPNCTSYSTGRPTPTTRVSSLPHLASCPTSRTSHHAIHRRHHPSTWGTPVDVAFLAISQLTDSSPSAARQQLAMRNSPTNSSPSAARQQLAIVQQLADSSPSAARQQLAIHNSPTACLSQPTRSL